MATNSATVDFAVPRMDFKNIESGFAYLINLDIEDEAGAAITVTSWGVEMVITTFDGDAVDTLTVGDGISVSGSTINITLSEVLTAAMNGSNKYEMTVTVSAVEYPFLKGCIVVL